MTVASTPLPATTSCLFTQTPKTTTSSWVLRKERATPSSPSIWTKTRSVTAGKFWTVQYEAIAHPDAGDGSGGTHDEPVDLTTTLFVTASRDLEFDLTNAPSGQNLFIMFGDGSISDDPSEVGIVATGKNPLDQSANPGTTITAGDTVNTSQGGGDTTFGINNQMIDERRGHLLHLRHGTRTDLHRPQPGSERGGYRSQYPV